MTATTGPASSPQPPGLRRDPVGLREVTFQSITDMAPGAAIAWGYVLPGTGGG